MACIQAACRRALWYVAAPRLLRLHLSTAVDVTRPSATRSSRQCGAWPTLPLLRALIPNRGTPPPRSLTVYDTLALDLYPARATSSLAELLANAALVTWVR